MRNKGYIIAAVTAGAIVLIVALLWWRAAHIARNAPQYPSQPEQTQEYVSTPAPIVTPTEGIDEREERAEEPTQEPTAEPTRETTEEYAPDGNNIADMEQGDIGIYSPKAVTGKQPQRNTNIPALVAYGKKYLGTKYQYGATRGQDKSFDCSSFMYWIFKQSMGLTLPLDSRSQAVYVKTHGKHRWKDYRKAVAGDMMFFSSYKGTKASDYAGRSLTITHVGVIIGKDSKGRLLLLHTASNPTGVRIQTLEGHLVYRFVSMGRPW